MAVCRAIWLTLSAQAFSALDSGPEKALLVRERAALVGDRQRR
jgi:hypothetical protein